MKQTTPHILLATIGSAGDVHPMMALARALQQRGYRATVITSPFFEEYIRTAGIDFIPLGDLEHQRQVMDNPDLWHPRRAFQVLVDYAMRPLMRPLYDLLSDYDPDHTIVVSSPFLFGAHLAREKLGMPHATFHLQPVLLRSLYQTPIMGGVHLPEGYPHFLKRLFYRMVDSFVIDRSLARPLNNLRRELGLPPMRRIFANYLHSPQLNLGLFPEWFAPPQPDWPVNTQLTGFVAYDGTDQLPASPELLAFLHEGEPPLVFTAGTANQHAAEFFRESVAAAQQLGRRALLLSRYDEHIPAGLPPGIRYFDYAPFSEVLPHTAALIYHGGIGSTAQALAAGIPHLVMPLSHDQPDNALRLERLGVGETLPPERYQATAVARMLDRLLSDEQVAIRCRELAECVDFPAALEQTCAAILQLKS